MNFGKDEMVDMIFMLGQCHRNCLLASRSYAVEYPERRHPHESSFRRLLNRFVETGDVKYKKEERIKSATNEDKELEALLHATENPHTSQRELGVACSISERSVQRILKKNKYHAYHIQMHQALTDSDFENRLNFCNWASFQIEQNPTFFEFVLFSDEATFHNSGAVNRHNFHYYSVENPRIIREIDNQHRWSLNVWGAVIGNHVIGPHFFEGNLGGAAYLNFIQNILPGMLAVLPTEIRNEIWFQHDGAPAHYSRPVRDLLDQQFPNRWIGRGGPTRWPARSPDLTKIDFFVGIHKGNRV